MQYSEPEKLQAMAAAIKEMHRIITAENKEMFLRHDKNQTEQLLKFAQHVKELGEICFAEINALRLAMLGICVLVFENLPADQKEAYKEQRNQAMEILTRTIEKPKGMH